MPEGADGVPVPPGEPESVDVLIVGAGLTGIGAAYYLQRDLPRKSYVIAEARGASGGTWDLFRYPGTRSDSDLHTFGYEFRPWGEEEAIASRDKILAYLRDTAAEYGIDRKIRYHRRVVAASWSSARARWTVEIERTEGGEGGELAEGGARETLSCRWLLCAGGYYRYDEGYTPAFEGRDLFPGPVIHPQFWPEDLDYTGKRVVVIGSGATAVTLVPVLAQEAAHVTMVQRTPSYVLPVPAREKLDARLRALLGEPRAFAISRRKNLVRQQVLWRFCRRHPEAARKLIRRITVAALPAGYPVDEHFRPPYNPWDQRMCFAPDGDFFRAIRSGAASVVTSAVTAFTPGGVLLASGAEVPADIIVTATGLNVQAMGGIALTVDDAPVRLADTVAYKGMMLSGVPNFAYVFGYTNASWTLKVGLLCEHLYRLLAYMDAGGFDAATPVADPGMGTRPLLDFDPNYLKRAISQLPRQGSRAPWRTSPGYRADMRELRRPVTDPDLRFSASPAPSPADSPAAGPAAAGRRAASP
jgi:cation diffusion facilitator CzcD-associated flavoprotein CzcO